MSCLFFLFIFLFFFPFLFASRPLNTSESQSKPGIQGGKRREALDAKNRIEVAAADAMKRREASKGMPHTAGVGDLGFSVFGMTRLFPSEEATSSLC